MNHLPHPHPPANSPHVQRFSKAASQYNMHARVQKQSADWLWQWLQGKLAEHAPQFDPKAALDVGCGTGFLTQHLLTAHPHIPVHAIDLAPGMLEQLALHHPAAQHPHLHLHCMDGEQLALEHLWLPSQSLLVSNLCAQWFNHLADALRGWLSISNVVAISVLLDGSFEAWHQAHRDVGEPCGLRPLPTQKLLEDIQHSVLAEGLCQHAELVVHEWLEHHADGLSFARSLKAIGADQASTGHRPARLKRVLQSLGPACTMNHRIAYLYLQR